MNTCGNSDSIETIIPRDNASMKKKESKRLEESTLKQTYIVPTVNNPALRTDNDKIERIANRLKITDKRLSENDMANEKEMPFILHNVELAKFSDQNNKSIDEEITEKRTCETTLGTLMFKGDEYYGKEGSGTKLENFYDCNMTRRNIAQNLKFEATNQHFSIGSQDTLYPSRQFRKANSLLPNIDERIEEYSASNEQSNFCQHRNGCTATFVPPEEISSGIFKRNCLEKIEILQQWETEVTEREINVRKKEKEVFTMQKELRIAARVLCEKLKQIDQYLRCEKIMRVVDRKLLAQALPGELQKSHDELLKVPKEHPPKSMDRSDERSRVRQLSSEYRADKTCEFCGVSNTFDEIKRFINEHVKLNEARRFNEDPKKESDEFRSDKEDLIKKLCTHKISEKSDEFKSGGNVGEKMEKSDGTGTLDELVKRDEVRRFDEIKELEQVDGNKLEKSPDDEFLGTNNESAKTRERWRNSQPLASTREGPDIKARRSLRSGIHSSRYSRQSSTANSRIRMYSSLRYKERPKISYDDLNSTLSADPGDSSLVRTSEPFLPHVYKRPSAFARSASTRIDARRKTIVSQETIDVEGKLDRDIEEEKVLRRFSENIQASRDKNTKFQHYGLVDHTPRDTQATTDCNSHRKALSYLNLEVDKHTRCKSEISDFSTTRPRSCNIEMDEWLQKKRLAYTLAIKTKLSDDKENLECNTVTGKDKKSSKKKKKILTIFGV